jgi:hypothetical protein
MAKNSGSGYPSLPRSKYTVWRTVSGKRRSFGPAPPGKKWLLHRNFPRCRGVAPSHEQHVQEMPMAKKEKTLEDLFHETLKDIYYAEKKILTALPKMAKAAQSEDPAGRL